jgi:hypothetical protein
MAGIARQISVQKGGHNDLLSTRLLHGVNDPLVFPGVDKCPVDRLAIGKDFLYLFDQQAAAFFIHGSQDSRNTERLRSLSQTRDIVYDHGGVVAVKVRELKRLMIYQ